jgi:chromosome segregation protein
VRIERLTLERYGSLENRTLNFRPDAALHVVVGANETGKTTTLSAIGDLIFGFPPRTPYGFAHKLELLRLGGALRLGDGAFFEMRRRKGVSNTLVDADDKPMPDEALKRALAGVTRETFETEFGLTAAALREGGEALLKAGGKLAETLAASSAGLSALSRLRERLAADAEALFTARKSAGKPFYLAYERHEQADRRLRDAVVSADALKGADDAILQAKADRMALEAEHEENGKALQRLQRALRTRPKLARLNDLTGELQTLADLPALAAATISPWRAAFVDDAASTQQLAALALSDAADHAKIDELAVNGPLLEAGEAVDALRERLGAVRKAIEDLPNRVAARNAARASLAESARRLGLADHDRLLATLPTDAALARAQSLIAVGRSAIDKRRDCLDRRDRASSEHARLAATAGDAPVDPEPLRRRLEAMADVGADADRLRRDGTACEAERLSLAEAAAALDPPAGEPDRLAKLPLPDAASIASHVSLADAAAEARREADDRIASEDRAIGDLEAKRKTLARAGAVATRSDLIEARRNREAAFSALGETLDGDATDRRSRFAALGSASRAIDDITDIVLSDAGRAARLEAMEEQIRDSREKRSEAAARVADLERRRGDEASQWIALWATSGLAPRAPAEMARWRERVAGIVSRRGSLMARLSEIDALAAKVESRRAALIGILRDHGATPDSHLPADLLFREAQAMLAVLQRDWTASRAQEEARRRAGRDVTEAAAALERAEAVLSDHSAQWPAAAAAIGLVPTASLEEADAALGVWRNVAAPSHNLASEQHRIDRIEEDFAAFNTDVGALVVAAAPELAGRDARDALASLYVALAAARRALQTREQLQRAIEERREIVGALEARREAASAVIKSAVRRLGVADAAELGPALDRLDRREALEGERSELTRDLAAIADGFDEATLRLEQDGLDVDAAPAQIERLELRQKALLGEIGEASAKLRQAENDREALARGRDAVGAARDRAEAAAELTNIAERWIAQAAAAELAKRAIERRRAAIEDPLVARAGALFSIATAQSFVGLGADYGKADEPILVAVRANGKRVEIEGLSEGARDQLFLALRLALLERRAAEPLPFIGDDLLASFDESRTQRTLTLLAEFGRSRQVILFTHHLHVAELAAAAGDPAIEVLRI